MTYEVKDKRVVRTAKSMALFERRAILEVDTTKYRFEAQEKADEKWLSRSKPYPNKGRAEAGRRLARMQAHG